MHSVIIVYCTQCRWMLRAAWMAQELLSTFDGEIAELTLKPGTGGIFEVTADNQLVWSRKQEGRFPEITELKQRVRDVIAPEQDLGHSERKKVKFHFGELKKGRFHVPFLFLSAFHFLTKATILLRTDFFGAFALGCFNGQYRPLTIWTGFFDRFVP